MSGLSSINKAAHDTFIPASLHRLHLSVSLYFDVALHPQRSETFSDIRQLAYSSKALHVPLHIQKPFPLRSMRLDLQQIFFFSFFFYTIPSIIKSSSSSCLKRMILTLICFATFKLTSKDIIMFFLKFKRIWKLWFWALQCSLYTRCWRFFNWLNCETWILDLFFNICC